MNALKGIANDDYLKNIFPRIDYAEMYLENLSVLLFGKCPHRNKYQNKLNKLFKKLENTCKKKCRVMGYDYFFFYPQEAEEVDYIQSYYDIHSEHEDVLGQPIYSLNWKLNRKRFMTEICLCPLIKITIDILCILSAFLSMQNYIGSRSHRKTSESQHTKVYK